MVKLGRHEETLFILKLTSILQKQGLKDTGQMLTFDAPVRVTHLHLI